MTEKYEKYAEVLLKKGLGIKKNQPLFISAPMENYEFVRILTKKAYEYGVVDIYYELLDEEMKHDALKYLDVDNLKDTLFFDKYKFDEYAKKDAAFLMLVSDDPFIMNDIDSDKISKTAMFSRKSKPLYKKRQLNNEISWCIACTATKGRAKAIFGSESDISKLWEAIFDVCFINTNDPCNSWDNFIEENSQRIEKLNNLKIKRLHYTNNLGTDLYLELLPESIWVGAKGKTTSGQEFIANIPSLEVFTTPNRLGTNGIVYASKPLIYNGAFIDKFYIKFENGKVISFDAEKGKEALKGIIESDETSSFLGEVALVDYNSAISKSGLIHYETLYDENASCHLALGVGFTECVKNSENKSKEELLKMGFNYSDNHVDFMVGTSDLKIEAETFNGEKINIFENGNFTL